MSDTKTMPGKVEKSEAEWRKELTPMQYAVLREKATERPFSGEYEHEQRPGTYTCAGCGQTLFESDAKFDSGCGWPSFTAPAAGRPCRRGARRQPRHGPDRSVVLEMQRPSRPCVRGRPRPDRLALLHQFGGAEAAAEVEPSRFELTAPRDQDWSRGVFSFAARAPGKSEMSTSRLLLVGLAGLIIVHVIQPALPPTRFRCSRSSLKG